MTQTVVTMKTIADELGVSVTTVARALKGGERIGAETIRKVNEMADRLGYVRNLDAVKLRTGQTFVILAILSVAAEEEIGDPAAVGLLNGIHERLAGTEYALRVAPVTFDEDGLSEVRRALKGRNADGFILDMPRPQDTRINMLLEHDIPFVTFGQTDFHNRHAYFDIDNEHAAWQGTNALLERGYRRIGLLEFDPRYSFVARRIAGFKRALEERGIAPDPDFIRHIEINPTLAQEAGEAFVRMGADALVCVNELTFLGARAGVRAALGDRASEFGFSMRSGTNLGAYLGTRNSAVCFSRREVGWNLADLLLQRLNGVPIEACQMVRRTELREY